MYPVNSFLSQTIKKSDEIKVVLLIKNDGNAYCYDNVANYKTEIEAFCNRINNLPKYEVIETDFDQTKDTHAQLLGSIIDAIDNGSHIIADVTYGPKDLPIVVFSALFFAENYLQCDIDNIIYGQAFFEDNKVVRSNICDMIPLYYLSSLSNTINCDDPQKARLMIKSLLSI